MYIDIIYTVYIYIHYCIWYTVYSYLIYHICIYIYSMWIQTQPHKHKHTNTQHPGVESSLVKGADSWLAGPLGVLSFLFSVLVSRTLVAVKEAPGIFRPRGNQTFFGREFGNGCFGADFLRMVIHWIWGKACNVLWDFFFCRTASATNMGPS